MSGVCEAGDIGGAVGRQLVCIAERPGGLPERMVALGVPGRLSFARLLFYPLELLIDPVCRWRADVPAIPCSVVEPMAEHVRLAMGSAAGVIEAELGGRWTSDVGVVVGLGARLWPEAAAVLNRGGMLEDWAATDLSDACHGPLTRAVAALLAEACGLLRLGAEAATGLPPPGPDIVRGLLGRVGTAVLPMIIALLLDGVPGVAPVVAGMGPATGAAMEVAAEVLVEQLEQPDMMERRIAVGTLAEAGASAGRMVALLGGLEAGGKTVRRRRVRGLRERLDLCCSARFSLGVDALLGRLAGGDVLGLEAAARGLRLLETEGRVLGSGLVYDRLLREAAERVVRVGGLAEPERVRLVEILRGPDAALAMLTDRG